MTTSAPLDRLAARHGITASYRDMAGRTHATSAETKRALLAAMGVAAASDAEARSSLAAAREAAPILPAGLVVGCEAPARIPLRLPPRTVGADVRWRLRCEDGTVRDGRSAIEAASARGGAVLALGVTLPPGDHVLELGVAGREATGTVIAAPATCIAPEELIGDRRAWGVSVQLYGLRTASNWGIGDFRDLAELARGLARLGADFVGVSPLHALFPADPGHFSPYGPSNRSQLNPLYLAPDVLDDFAASEGARRIAADVEAEIAALRDADLVDYRRVSALKLRVLERMFADFRTAHLGRRPSARGRAFRSALDEQPEMAQHALFDALHEHFYGRDRALWSWRRWPTPYRDPRSPAVARFARDRSERVEFFAYLQWLAGQQLASAQEAARGAGMAIGLYGDLAVGADPGGSAAWCHQDVIVAGASIGAPADDFNPLGQSWGLAPPAPRALGESGYAPFRAALRASMRHAGALRIDHAMALARLFWVPAGAAPAAGAYIRYPEQDMVRLVALESRRARCIVIGEDLGTVPEGFRATMRDAAIQSYRVLWFERDRGGRPRPPRAYPEHALATASTHDLPTVAGFWRGRDLDWRERLGLLGDSEDAAAARARRARDKRALWKMLIEAGVLDGSAGEADDLALVGAVYRLLADAPSRLLAVQYDDLCLEVEQANLPGTGDEHPNWRRRAARTPEALLADPAIRALLARIDRARRAGAGG